MTTKLLGARVALGELKVGKEIGKGGFGVVHEASIAGISFPFAVKFLDPSPFNADLASARARFFREAELLFKLRHPHIVAIYGVGEHEGRPYILMEKFAGLNLHAAREKGAPEPVSVLPFIEYVASALGYAHSQDVVHRDIKPRNLMALKGDGRVLDFGIAALLDPEGARFTRTGGTPVGDAFSAPELLDDPRRKDPRCDIYSLGACWFWLLTGKAPKGVNWEAALRSSVKVSPDYERVVLRCLEQPDARYATMGELAAEVRALQAGDKPKAGLDGIGDDDAVVLGVIASACPTPGDTTSFYHVEQELTGGLSRLAMGVANRKLLRLGLIETSVETDWNGNDSSVLRLSAAGERWTETHQAHIAGLLASVHARRHAQVAPTSGDDIPF
jgi:serine/threonine protein kinase